MTKSFLMRSFLVLLVITYFVGPRVWGKERAGEKSVLDNLKFVQGDEEGNEKKAIRAEMLVSATEQKAIAQVQKLIKKYRNTQLEPDLQFRLAEMYMRKSKTDRFFELHRESSTNIKISPRLATKSGSKASLTQAVETYQYIQKKFPGYQSMDLVIFNHAFARQALGQEKDAEALYLSLIKRFSESPLVPDAYLAIGEIAFQKAQFPRALEYFNSIAKFPDSRVYPYGLYKTGWTHYNLRNTAAGLKSLEEVVAYGDMVAKNNLDAKLDLRKEALSDMVLFFEDVHPAKNAYRYFVKQAGEKEAQPLLMRLADLYQRHARYNDERQVLQQFAAELPGSTMVPDIYARLVTAADNLKNKNQAVADLEDFSNVCTPKGKFAKANPTLIDGCVTTLRRSALIMAERWLKIWNKNPHDETFAASSEKVFEIYLRVERKDAEYNQSRFLYAELLFKRKKYRQAADHYYAVGLVLKDKIGHSASYGACLSLEKAVGDKWSAEDEKLFHQYAKNYVTTHPQGAYRLEIEFKMGFLAYEKGRYDEAAPILLRLGQSYSADAKGQKAQDLYLDILNLRKDYHGLRLTSKDMLKKTTNPERITKLRKIYEQAYFLEIQKMEENGQLKKAVAEYQVFARENNQSDLSEKANWNVIQLNFKIGDSYAAAQASLDFAKRYPRSAHSTPALASAAQTFEQMAQLTLAADVLIQLAERDQDNRVKWKETAADFYAMSNNAGKARKLYYEIMPLLKEESRIRLYGKLDSFEKSYGINESRAQLRKEIIAKDIPPMAQAYKVEKVEKLLADGNMTDAFNDAKRVLSSGGMSNSDKARARFVQARVLQREFESQSVKARPDRIALVLSIKTEKLAKAEEAFQSTIRFGDPATSIDAMEQLFNSFNHYVTSLRAIPAPEDMTPAEQKAFLNELNNLIIPLEDKSVDILSQALAFARKHPRFDSKINHLEAELARLNQRPQVISYMKVDAPKPVAPVREWGTL